MSSGETRDVNAMDDKNGGLVLGVVAFDVVGRVGFGVAFRLRFGQHIGEVGVFGGHFGKNIVRRAVDDAHDLGELVGGQRLFERLDNRDAAADTAFKAEVQIAVLGLVQQIMARFRHHFFVGRDDVFAVLDRPQDQIMRGVNAADQLADNVDFGVVGDIFGPLGQKRRVNSDIARLSICPGRRCV